MSDPRTTDCPAGFALLLAGVLPVVGVVQIFAVPNSPVLPVLVLALAVVLAVVGYQLRGRNVRKFDTLRAQQSRLRSILNGMSTAVLAVDRSGIVLGLNPAARQVLDITTKHPMGESLESLEVSKSLLDFVEDAFMTTGCHTAELMIDGTEERNVIVRSESMHDLDGGVEGMVLVLDDVTQLRRLETMRSDFAANVSHELRTPITAIQGYAELLEDASEQEGREYAQVILRNSKRLSDIIEDLTALSRLEDKQQVDLPCSDEVPMHELLAAVSIACMQETVRESVTLSLECPEHLMSQGSRALLEQAVTNLVTNAIRYGGSGSTVELNVGQSGSGMIVISVIDHGSGIPQEHHGRVFERFYRVDRGRSRQVGGTGLGLAIVKHIALAHGGSVSLSETPGGGCTFALALPPAERLQPS